MRLPWPASLIERVSTLLWGIAATGGEGLLVVRLCIQFSKEILLIAGSDGKRQRSYDDETNGSGRSVEACIVELRVQFLCCQTI